MLNSLHLPGCNMLSLLAISVILNCSTISDIADVNLAIPKVVARQSTVTLIADSREEHDRREQEIREHEAASAQRAKELQDRAADTAKETHDEKIPARNAHDFHKSF
jgi:hypothetical protein